MRLRALQPADLGRLAPFAPLAMVDLTEYQAGFAFTASAEDNHVPPPQPV